MSDDDHISPQLRNLTERAFAATEPTSEPVPPPAGDPRPAWFLAGDHYVLIVEDDCGAPFVCDRYGTPKRREISKGKTIVWEHEVGIGTTWEGVNQQAQRIGKRYGRRAIAQLEIVMVER